MSEVLERIGRLSLAKQRLLQRKLSERSGSRVPPLGPSPQRRSSPWLPCSFAQQRFWFLHQMEPLSPAYNLPQVLRLSGHLDVPALARALAEVVRRHEVLRSTFTAGEQGPMQTVAPCARVSLPRIDLRRLPAPRRAAEVADRVEAAVCRPFDLERGPLLHALLLRGAADEHVFVLSLHHVVCDGWSLGLLVREMVILYGAFRAGAPSPLPELPIQYADFADWQRRWLRGDVLTAQLDYWRRRLAGLAPLLTLPTDRPRPAVRSWRGASRSSTAPASLTRQLEALAARQGTTLFTAVLTAFQVLLCRYSNQEDVCVGTPVAGRRDRATEDLVGCFVNMLAVRCDLSGDPPFRELLERMRGAVLDDQANQDVPFERLVDELKIERSLARTPIFQVALAFQNAPRAAAAAGLALAPLAADTGTAKFDLTLSLAAGEAGLGAALEYSTDLFDAATAERLLGHFQRLLEAVAADPGRRLWSLPLLAPRERHQLLRERGAGALPPTAAASLHQLFAAQAARSPQAAAVICEGRRLSYGELDHLASRWAQRLRLAGVGPETRVGLHVERSVAMVVGMLAILKAGGAYVPIEPAYPEERVRFLLADAGIRVLLTQGSLPLGTVATAAGLPGPLQVIDLDQPPPPDSVEGDGAAASADDANNAGDADGAGADPDQLAYVIYTSGSTGRPKGVGVSHANVARLFTTTADRFGFGPGDTWTLFHSHAFDFSVWEIWGALLHGGTLLIVPYWVSRSPAAFHRLLVEERVTVLSQTPAAFRQLVEADGAAGGWGLALRWIVFGGEALDFHTLGPWFERHGDERPRLLNMYGITETTVHVTWRALRRADLARGAASLIGAALPDLSLRVLDRNLEPVPLGVPGEIYVGGGGVARGYLGNPELTAARFVPDPFADSSRPGARLYRSGDLARPLPDGDHEYLGRIDHQVKVRGFRIELGEIEAALAEHPAVRQAVVAARAEGGGDKRLVAYLVAGPEPLPEIDQLRAFLGRLLPEHMIPAAFVPLAALPLTANGKLDRGRLPDPGDGHALRAGGFTAPRTAAERLLAEIWSSVLEVEQVGANDSFFALGGDSILSLRVRSLAAQRGLHFELQDLFRHQTVAELARAARQAPEEEAPALAPFALISTADRELLPAGLEDAYPPSFLQLGMLFDSERQEEATAYHNVASYRLRGPLDPAALEAALARLAGRHPVLRTAFDTTRFSEPLQLVHREARIALAIDPGPDTGDDAGDEAPRERLLAERRRHFDWRVPPLLRVWVSSLAAGAFELGIAEHHAILDGWSYATLLSELFTLYAAELDGEAAPLAPPPAASCRDYVTLERRALASEESRRYWRQNLAGHVVLAVPRWPGERPPPAEERIQDVGQALPSDLDAALGRCAEAAGVPLKSVLLAAHLRVLELLGGSADVLTGLVANGRPETPGSDRALGLFLNSLPFRLRLGAGSWRDLVRAAFAAELEGLPHRRVPLAELQRRESAGAPLFEVLFNYTHFHVLGSLGTSPAAPGGARLEILAATAMVDTNFTLGIDFSRAPLGPPELWLLLQYDSAQIHRAQALSYAEMYLRALAALARGLDQPFRQALWLSAAESHQLIREWNDTGAAPGRRDPAHPAGRCLHELVEAQVERTPAAVAAAGAESCLSYRELDLRADCLAHELRSRGVGPEITVGLCVERSPEMLVGMLGILKAGGAYVPLDPDYPRQRLATIIEDAGVSVLVVQERLAARLPAGTAQVVLLDRLPDRQPGGREAQPLVLPASRVGPDSLACVLYTSGSTGRPKGVMLCHAGLVNRLLWAERAYPVTAADRVLQKAPFSFDFSVWECFGPLLAGAPVVFARPGGHRDAAYLASLVREQAITLLHFVPSMLREFLAEPDLERCGSLRYLFSGGEVLSPELAERCRARVPAVLRNQYGPTEISIDTTDWVCGPADSRLGFVPLGRPIAGTAVHVLDVHGEPAPVGVAGELCIAGGGVARGYLGRPRRTAERFRPDPFAGLAGARLYHTGDRVRRLHDGNLEFLGRADQQVKVRGFRVEPGEIEMALRGLPAVGDAAVVARRRSDGDCRLVAYLVAAGEPASPAEPPSAAELRRELAGRLPEHMLPAAFVWLPALPRNAHGKLDRGALPEPGQTARPARAVRPPRDDVELRLAQVWEDLLELRPVGVDDDFFTLGGHSLLALRLMGAIERVFEVRLPLSALLEAPTVERLALRLRRAAGPLPYARPLLVPLQPGGSRPPLLLVHPVGGNVLCYLSLARHAGLGGPVYALQSPPADALPSPWTVEAMAEVYLAALRQAQPAGPYLLAGWSMGGVVAFEMARQLAAAGQSAALVAMLDVGAPGEGGGSDDDPESELLQFLYDLRGVAGLDGLPPLDRPAAGATLDDLLRRDELRSALPPDVDEVEARRLFSLFCANRRALRRYRPLPCSARLTLVHAAATVAEDAALESGGWHGLAEAGAETHILPGDHYSLLAPSRVAALAELLETAIRSALAGAADPQVAGRVEP